MSRFVRILPYYEARMREGGSRLRGAFHYAADVAPLGEVYSVAALENHADRDAPEMNMKLSHLLFRCIRIIRNGLTVK